ncbi:MAG: helix-turn-helix transcriptional regulator, partial [Rhodospirillales bacterium]|nr:helix-turn-helix transcriptional regulator [Rhodospirillales bacterium]
MTKSNSARSEKPRKVRRLPPGTPNPVDIHVGARVRLRRTLLGISQERLGDAVGLTFQQIQKYERGANRIGASRIYELSRILDVPVSFFFEDMPDELETHEGRFSAGLRDKEQGT